MGVGLRGWLLLASEAVGVARWPQIAPIEGGGWPCPLDEVAVSRPSVGPDRRAAAPDRELCPAQLGLTTGRWIDQDMRRGSTDRRDATPAR